MLRACRRVLRPGGLLAFYTIHMTPGLSEAHRRRAAQLGPPAVASASREQSELLRSAGLEAISESDLTDEFLRIARGWGKARLRHADGLRESEGADQFEEKLADNRAGIEGIEAGLLRRALFVAERPG